MKTRTVRRESSVLLGIHRLAIASLEKRGYQRPFSAYAQFLSQSDSATRCQVVPFWHYFIIASLFARNSLPARQLGQAVSPARRLPTANSTRRSCTAPSRFQLALYSSAGL